jgi:hypothetical protein
VRGQVKAALVDVVRKKDHQAHAKERDQPEESGEGHRHSPSPPLVEEKSRTYPSQVRGDASIRLFVLLGVNVVVVVRRASGVKTRMKMSVTGEHPTDDERDRTESY